MSDGRDRTIRIIAGFCLAILVGSWAPHAHPDSSHTNPAAAAVESDDRTTNSVSDDDAHEDHSSSTPFAERDCLFCRSSEDRESDRSPSPGLIDAPRSEAGSILGRTYALADNVSLRIHSPRGPPTS